VIGVTRPPPARVMLFAASLACIFAAIGLVRLMEMVTASHARAGAAALAAALVVALGITTLRDDVVRQSEETNALGLRDASEIARFLIPQLRAADRIVAGRNSGVSLDYYLLACGRRRLAEFDSGGVRGRVFVIVDERHRQSLASVRRSRSDFPWDERPTLVPLRKFDGSAVYEAFP
jgi:hypothetical protein